MAAEGAGRQEQAATALKVFISYSRADVAFADELELALRDKGHAPLVDRHGIDAGEDWQRRLGDLILSSDTVVFVLTETSAGSHICAWEVEEAARLSKRMLVVAPGPVPKGTAPPPQLAGINWVHCWRNPAIPGSSQTKGFLELDEALRANLGWLREMTVLQEQADRWRGRMNAREAAGTAGASSMLLRGNVLAEALDWMRRTPKDARAPELVVSFIEASEALEAQLKAEAEAGLKEKEEALTRAATASRRVRRASLIGASVAALFLVGAVVAGWFALQMQQAARIQQAEAARKSSDVLALQSKALADQNLFETAILMALQADPAAQRQSSEGDHQGYAFARARLTAAFTQLRLERVLRGHTDRVEGAVFSPDARHVVTIGDDDRAIVWDRATGLQLGTFAPNGDAEGYTTLTYEPSGQLLILGTSSGNIEFRDTTTWQPRPLNLEPEPGGWIHLLKVSQDGRHLLSATETSNNATLRKISDGSVIWSEQNLPGLVVSAYFSTRSDQLVLYLSDLTMLRVSVASGRVEWASEPKVAWTFPSRSGRRVLLWSQEGRLSAEVTRGEVRRIPISDQISSFPEISFNEESFVVGQADGSIEQWRFKEDRRSHTYAGHYAPISSVALSMDNAWLLSASDDQTARIWNFADATDGLVGLYNEPIGLAVFSSNDLLLIRRGEELTFAATGEPSYKEDEPEFQLLDAASGDVIASILDLSQFLGFSRDRSKIVGLSTASEPAVWDARSGRRLYGLHHGTEKVVVASLKDTSELLISGSPSGKLQVWDIASGKLVTETAGVHEPRSVALSSNGRVAAVGASDGSVSVIDLGTGKTLQVIKAHDAPIVAIAFAASDSRIVTTSEGGRSILWDTDSGRPIVDAIPDNSGATTSNISLGGDRLLAVAGFSARVLDVDDGKTVALMTERDDLIDAGAFSPDGRFVAVLKGKNVSIWDVATSELLSSASLEARRDIVGLGFSPDGTRLVLFGYLGVGVWTVPEIVRVPARRQVEIACQRLHAANAPLAFSKDDVTRYPVLAGEPEDPDDPGMLLSPCEGVLPDEAFAKPFSKPAIVSLP